MSPERWLPVVGWDGYYEVSDHGRVWSCARVIERCDGQIMTLPGRMRTPAVDSSGHFQLQLCRDCRHVNAFVHHLVLEAFVGPRPDGLECRHLDDVKSNNHVSNLCWGTGSENRLDRTRNRNRRPAAIKEPA
jgi:hypothetical protein